MQLVHCNWFALPVDYVCLSVCTSFCTSHFDNRLPSAIGSMQMLCTACRSCLSDCPSAALICPSEDCNWFILCPVDHVCLFVCLHFPSGWSVIKCNWFPASLSAPLISSSMSCQSFSDHLAYWLSNTGCNCFTKHFFFFTWLPAYQDHPTSLPHFDVLAILKRTLQFWINQDLGQKKTSLQGQLPYSFLLGGRGKHLYRWPEIKYFKIMLWYV